MVGVRELIAKMKDKDEDTRSKAAKALGKVGGKLAVFVLIRALRDKWWVTRCNAADSLAAIGDKRAVPALIKVVDEDDYGAVRVSAATALAQLGSKRALPHIRKFVRHAEKVHRKLKGRQIYGVWVYSPLSVGAEYAMYLRSLKKAIRTLSKSS